MNIVQDYININKEIKDLNKEAKLIVVTKGQDSENIKKILDCGHTDFGENKVQESILKWSNFLNDKLARPDPLLS
jgi:uncharacterized pyridoxal phosphate-containing UPF0001 family protein